MTFQPTAPDPQTLRATVRSAGCTSLEPSPQLKRSGQCWVALFSVAAPRPAQLLDHMLLITINLTSLTHVRPPEKELEDIFYL